MSQCALKLYADDGHRIETLTVEPSRERLCTAIGLLWDHQTYSDMSCEEFNQYSLARSLVREKSYHEAVDVLRWPYPAQAESFNLLGLASELSGDFDEARIAYGKALQLRSDSWTAQMNLRRIYEIETFGHSLLPYFF